MISLLQALDEPLVLGGDARCDSPGFCAKYGSYTIMELKHNAILDIELVQSNEVSGSANMEKEGLVRAIKLFEEQDLDIELIVTDRHKQASKWIREEMPDTIHKYDIWHVAKGLRKKLEKASNNRTANLLLNGQEASSTIFIGV
jgi:solute carrier family 8 (sodium/calcium exchanger)